MQHSSEDRDFSAYNAAQGVRGVRPLARRAVALRQGGSEDSETRNGEADRREAVTPLPAVELGSGVGVEARYLAESGFSVWTYDVDPSVQGVMTLLAAEHPVHHTTIGLESLDSLPSADLILSCASLPFVRRSSFDALWSHIIAALRPGGVLAVDLFGDRDEWAGGDGTFLRRTDVEELLEGLEVEELREDERDGASFSGPKHWHTYQVIARRGGLPRCG